MPSIGPGGGKGAEPGGPIALWRGMTEPTATPPATADGPEDLSSRDWKRVAVATWKDSGEDNLSLVAAGVGFYAFLAFVPLLTAFVLSYGLFAEPASVVSHMQALTRVMPQDAAAIIGDQLQSMTESSGARTGIALLVAIGIALYGASKGAESVITALRMRAAGLVMPSVLVACITS